MDRASKLRAGLTWGTIGMACMALTACHRKPLAAATPAPRATVVTPNRPPAPPPPPAAARSVVSPPLAAPTEAELFGRKSLAQLNDEHPLTDAFFTYDQATLSDEARSALAADARWLGRWPSTRIKIEGHCDERGTEDYNLALGERRAQVTEAYLVALGVPAARIQVVSFGEDAPFCRETGEGCWSQNRRGHLVITAK